MKFAAFALFALLSAFATNSNASVVTVGSLTRDTTQSTISDSLNNRTWLGFDITKGLTYAQTVTATSAGGTFAGFSIAHNYDAQLFTNALLSGGSNLCTISDNSVCSVVNLNSEHVVGESYFSASSFGGQYDFDIAYFLSDNGVGLDVGIVYIFSDYSRDGFNLLIKNNDWTTFANADTNSILPYSIGWLLFREATSNAVPEPGSLALLGIAGVVLAWSQRRLCRGKKGPGSD